MPAQTVAALSKSLSRFLEPGETLLETLNMVLPRLHAMGYWRDLLFEEEVVTDHSYLSLPRGGGAVIAAMVDDHPSGVSPAWQDFKTAGYFSSGPPPIYGLIDSGYAPALVDLNSTDETYQIRVEPLSPDTVIPSRGQVSVTYLREDDVTKTHVFVLNGSASLITAEIADEKVILVKQIQFRNVPAYVTVTAVADSATGVDLTLATERGDVVPRYRRFRLSNPTGMEKTARLFMKREHEILMSDTDVVYLSNLNVLKHGIMATVAENAADIERASYHWGVCRGLLEEEMDSSRGAAKPILQINPWGESSFRVPNIM